MTLAYDRVVSGNEIVGKEAIAIQNAAKDDAYDCRVCYDRWDDIVKNL